MKHQKNKTTENMQKQTERKRPWRKYGQVTNHRFAGELD
jgi:hypothetical protein